MSLHVQVSPAELEAILIAHPAMNDAAVVGIPDEEAGEIPAACIILQPNTYITEREIGEKVAGKADENNDLHREDTLRDQDDEKEKVADGQTSNLAISEKTDDITTGQGSPSNDGAWLMTEKEMTDVVKAVLEKERVAPLTVKNLDEDRFDLSDEHLFPSLSSVPTRIIRRTQTEKWIEVLK